MIMRSLILDEIRMIALEQEKDLPELTDDLDLQDFGFDSLCFAILFARLEDITGRDPLNASNSAEFPRTLTELFALYEEAAA
jgi:hypothetical protein